MFDTPRYHDFVISNWNFYLSYSSENNTMQLRALAFVDTLTCFNSMTLYFTEHFSVGKKTIKSKSHTCIYISYAEYKQKEELN